MSPQQACRKMVRSDDDACLSTVRCYSDAGFEEFGRVFTRLRIVPGAWRNYRIATSSKTGMNMLTAIPALSAGYSGFTATKLPLFPTVKCMVSSKMRKSLQCRQHWFYRKLEQAASLAACRILHNTGTGLQSRTHLKAGMWLGNAISATPSSV